MTNAQSSPSMNIWDRLGIFVSATCLVHCLLTPLVIIAIPAMTNLGANEGILHLTFAILAIPVAGYSLWHGYKQHGIIKPTYYAVPGIALLWIAMLVHEPHWMESVVTSFGALLVITAHFINHRLTRHC